MMLNPELKKQLIEDGTSEKYRKTRVELVKTNSLEYCEKAKSEDFFAWSIFGTSPENVTECERIRNNALRQRNKIEDHLEFLIKGNWTLYFLTLTFSDKCLRSTSFNTRKQTIRRLLSSFCDDFILNVDYGTENEREHYHAIIAIVKGKASIEKDEKGHLKIDVLSKCYRYGFYSIEEIKTDQKDKERLARYITKLTMHSVKVRQNYVSVKKNSPYQNYVKMIDQVKKRLPKDINEKAPMSNNEIKAKLENTEAMTYLLSGYFQGT